MPSPARLRRAFAPVTVALVAAVALSSCYTGGQEKATRLINQARAADGLGAVRPTKAAMDKAQAWSRHMAATGVLEHTGGGDRVDPGPLKGWCTYGENVGYGASVDAVHHAFLSSPAHRANTLGRTFTFVGTGVHRKGSRVWVTEIYLRMC